MSKNSLSFAAASLAAVVSIVLAYSSAFAGTSSTVEVITPVGGSIGVQVGGSSGSQGIADVTGLNSLMDTAQMLFTSSLESLQITQSQAEPDAPPAPGDHPGPNPHACDNPHPPPGCTISPVK
jgi:hypothetical protein